MNEATERYRRGGGVVAAILHELVKAECFTSYGDLAEALKCRLATLRIPYNSGLVSDAITQVECSRGRPLVPREWPRRVVERAPEPVIIDRATAQAIVGELDRRSPGRLR